MGEGVAAASGEAEPGRAADGVNFWVNDPVPVAPMTLGLDASVPRGVVEKYQRVRVGRALDTVAERVSVTLGSAVEDSVKDADGEEVSVRCIREGEALGLGLAVVAVEARGVDVLAAAPIPTAVSVG